jgi:DNA polymerase-3 subunit epsilon
MNFTAIGFETATGYRNSACVIGVVTVENSEIIDEYYTLIRPPSNDYWHRNIRVHGIHPEDTENVPTFAGLYSEIKSRLQGQTIVAHNEVFDRGVLKNTMEHYGLNYHELNLPARWECTLQIYRARGFKPCKLSDCCQHMNIPLNHHEALSDAIACAKLYLRR